VLLPVSIVSLVFCALGVRLLRTALQASGAEGWLAGFFLYTAAAMPLRTVLSQDHAVMGELEPMLILLSHGLMTAALCAHTIFVARVFRPDVVWRGRRRPSSWPFRPWLLLHSSSSAGIAMSSTRSCS
jgi:hypothetical protein